MADLGTKMPVKYVLCIIFLEIQQFIVHKICNDAAGKEHSHQIFTLSSALSSFYSVKLIRGRELLQKFACCQRLIFSFLT